MNPQRILFITRRFGYLRNFERPIAELAARGHRLHLVALERDSRLEGLPMVRRWAEGDPRITFEQLASPPESDIRDDQRRRVHKMVDYLRYFEPAYRGADGLIARATWRTPRGLVRLMARPGATLLPVRRAIGWGLRQLEAATPRRPEIEAFLRAQSPDLVLLTPLVWLGSEEQDFLTAARELGQRTVFCVWSWDNLSSKSIIRTMPDLMTVWNDTQREEARQLHRVPAERIAVTGAQTFDHWFDRTPTRSREAFAARVGLPADRPFLLWVCSALFRGSPIEAEFVKTWISAIRGSGDPLLREVPILVRPHPSRLSQWEGVSLDGLGPVSLWGANPIDCDAKNDYFDSLYYSVAVAGLNTSAFLEAAIVGRPVYTVLLPEFRENQDETLHFPYLLRVGGGLLHAATDMDAHIRDLTGALRAPVAVAERSRRFVEAFIRPLGMGVSASATFVDAIEALAERPAAAPTRRAPLSAAVFARVHAWLEARRHSGAMKEWLMSVTEHERAEMQRARQDARRAVEHQRELEKQRRTSEARDAKLRLKEAGRAEKRRAKSDARHRDDRRVDVARAPLGAGQAQARPLDEPRKRNAEKTAGGER